MKENFDFGTEEQIASASGFKNPEVGPHMARLRSIIHCGLFCETFKGKKKKPAPEVVAVFELKEETDFEDDGSTPLTASKAFPIKLGDKTFFSKMMKVLDPDGTAGGFDDLIGAPCMVEIKGSKELNEDGSPKYVNFDSIAGMPKKFAAMVPELNGGYGVGHVRFEDLTLAAIHELNPALEVANILMKGEKFAGSKAATLIAEIRKDNPDFAKLKESSGDPGPSEPAREEVSCGLDEEQSF